MSFTKSASQAMEYELAGTKTTNTKAVMGKAYRKAVTERNSVYTLALLANKHKVGLLAIGNCVLVANYVFPEWTELVKSLFN